MPLSVFDSQWYIFYPIFRYLTNLTFAEVPNKKILDFFTLQMLNIIVNFLLLKRDCCNW